MQQLFNLNPRLKRRYLRIIRCYKFEAIVGLSVCLYVCLFVHSLIATEYIAPEWLGFWCSFFVWKRYASYWRRRSVLFIGPDTPNYWDVITLHVKYIVPGIAHQLAGLPGGEWGALARHYPPPLLPSHPHFTPHVLPPAHSQHQHIPPPPLDTGTITYEIVVYHRHLTITFKMKIIHT